MLEGGGREVGMLDLLHLGVGAIGRIGVIGLISLEAWSDGLCTGYPSSCSVECGGFLLGG